MLDKDLLKEEIRILAQRAEVDGTMDAKKAEELLTRDFEKAAKSKNAEKALSHTLDKYFGIK